MNKSNKIFLFLLAAIYFTHAYGRLLHLTSIHFAVISDVNQKASEEADAPSKKLLLHHRNHLPLTKKLEIAKQYPVIKSYLNNITSLEEWVTQILISYELKNSPYLDHPSNKAPPSSC